MDNKESTSVNNILEVMMLNKIKIHRKRLLTASQNLDEAKTEETRIERRQEKNMPYKVKKRELLIEARERVEPGSIFHGKQEGASQALSHLTGPAKA